MSDQLGLFDPDDGDIDPVVSNRARARSGDPDTSHEAAAAAELKLRESQKAVLAASMTFAGAWADYELVATYEAMSAFSGLPRQSPSGIRTRRKELCDLMLIEDTGLRREHQGRRHTLWRRRRPA